MTLGQAFALGAVYGSIVVAAFVMYATMALIEFSESAPDFKASHAPRMAAQGERDPSVMADCSGADTGRGEQAAVSIKPVHFFSYRAVTGDIAACALWEPNEMSGDLKAVTCKSCKRTHEFLLASASNAKRTQFHIDYRKPPANPAPDKE